MLRFTKISLDEEKILVLENQINLFLAKAISLLLVK